MTVELYLSLLRICLLAPSLFVGTTLSFFWVYTRIIDFDHLFSDTLSGCIIAVGTFVWAVALLVELFILTKLMGSKKPDE